MVVDAAGYRARRRASLERVAEDAARDALATGAPVKLEPMSAPERKIVHLALQERRGRHDRERGRRAQPLRRRRARAACVTGAVERWLEALVSTPGLTAIRDLEEARRVHVEDALTRAPAARRGPGRRRRLGRRLAGDPARGSAPRSALRPARGDGQEVRVPAPLGGRAPERRGGLRPRRGARDRRGPRRVRHGPRACARAAAGRRRVVPAARSPGRPARPASRPRRRTWSSAPPPRPSSWPAGSTRSSPSSTAERRRLLVFAKTGPTPERFPRRPGVARKRPLA